MCSSDLARMLQPQRVTDFVDERRPRARAGRPVGRGLVERVVGHVDRRRVGRGGIRRVGVAAALAALVAVLVEQKNCTEAVDWYKTLESREQPPPELSYNLGLLMQSMGDHASAARYYQIAVETRPGFSQAMLNLGHALDATGQPEEAQKAWGRAVAADPQLAAGSVS